MDQNQNTFTPSSGSNQNNQPDQRTVPPGAGLYDGLNYTEGTPVGSASQQPQAAPAPTPVDSPPAAQAAKPPQTTTQKYKKIKILLYICLGVIGVLLILSIVFGVRAFINTGHLNKKFAEGKEAGAGEQLVRDQEKIKDVTENPFRTYKAPDASGAFELSFPKNWNLMVTTGSAVGEITGLLNPDYVDSKADKYAMRFNLKPLKYVETQKNYDKIKKDSKGKVNSEEIVVSDIKGIRYFGRINKKDDKDKTIVILPVRDKSLILQTDNNEVYLSDFNRVLSQAKIYP